MLVVIIHYSSIYVEFFKNQGVARAFDIYILPVYPCHIFMWLLVIVAFIKNRETTFYKGLADFTFIGGTAAGLIGTLFNMNFLNADVPSFLNYDLLKGLLSHIVMAFGTLYLFVFNYVKLEVVQSTISVAIGLIGFSIIGVIINTLFKIFNIPSLNTMFMLEPPFKEYPFINFLTIGILGLLITFIGILIYEHFTLPKEERWVTKMKLERKR